MLNKLFHVWRVVATGWCFLTFNLGGLLLTISVFPLINLVYSEGRTKHIRAQRVVHYSFRYFVWQMQFLKVIKVDVSGMERLCTGEPKLILANHPSLIDVVIMIAQLKNTNCIVKQALWKSPFLGGVVRAAGYISNDDSEALIQDCVDAMANGDNIIIFPEGTRSVPGRPLKMQRGAAYIAARAGIDITPVVISCHPPTLTKSNKWYQVPQKPAQFKIEVGEKIAMEELLIEDRPASLVSRHITKFLENYFTERLSKFEIARAGA